MANNVDPDQTPQHAASDLGLHCLLWLVCPNIQIYYGRTAGKHIQNIQFGLYIVDMLCASFNLLMPSILKKGHWKHCRSKSDAANRGA